MSSAILQGIFGGLGEAYQKHHTQLFTQEQDRRKQLGEFLRSEMANPSNRPEYQDEVGQLYLELASTPQDKKLKTDFDTRIANAVSSMHRVQVQKPGAESKLPKSIGAGQMETSNDGTSVAETVGIPSIERGAPTPPSIEELPKRYSFEDQARMGAQAAGMNAAAVAGAQNEYGYHPPVPPFRLDPQGPEAEASRIRVAEATAKATADNRAPVVPPIQPLRDMATGVMERNPETGAYDIKRGDRPPTAGGFILPSQSYADLEDKAKARVDAVRDKVASGQYTISQGLSSLGGVRGGLGGALTESLSDALVLPVAVRTQNTDIERARNLLIPIRQIVDDIVKSKDLAEKVTKSFQLEQYVQSIGTQFARAKGERGVVTDRDVSRVLGLLTGWKSANFAPKFAADNLKIIEDTFNRDQNALMKGYFSTYDKGGAPTLPSSGTGGKDLKSLSDDELLKELLK